MAAGAQAPEGSFSTVACRGGTASRSTSERVPAYRAATAPVSAATSGVSTRSGLTTRRSGCSRPVCSVVAARSITKPSTSCPAKRTLTRTPGWASSAIVCGHGVVEGPVEVGQRHVDEHPGDRVDLGPRDRLLLLRRLGLARLRP